MFSFFDFVFFKISYWYKVRNDKSPEAMGSAVLSMFQVFNILSLKIIYDLIVNHHIILNKLYVAILAVTVMVFNYFRYEYFDKHNFLHEKQRWEALSIEKQKTTRLAIIIYLLLSFFSLFGLFLFG